MIHFVKVLLGRAETLISEPVQQSRHSVFLNFTWDHFFSKQGQLKRNGQGLQQKPSLAEQKGDNTHPHQDARTQE